MTTEKAEKKASEELRDICSAMLSSDDNLLIPAIKRLGLIIPKVKALEDANSTEEAIRKIEDSKLLKLKAWCEERQRQLNDGEPIEFEPAKSANNAAEWQYRLIIKEIDSILKAKEGVMTIAMKSSRS